MLCKNCSDPIPKTTLINGKKCNLQRRKFCLICSPYGSHNTKTTISLPNIKWCPKCEKNLKIDSFYQSKGRPTGYCKACHNAWIVEKQQIYKRSCISYKGGKCECCGYDRYEGSLEFHHKDPTQKDFMISELRHIIFNEATMSELDKCLLLCANCHREEHARLKGLI